MASGDVTPAWVDELERGLIGTDAASELALWKKHSVHRVPAAVRELHPQAYRPKMVSMGPFHHGDERLRPMAQHKRRAVRQLLRRSGRKLEELVAAVRAVAQDLEDAYQYLGDEWRGKQQHRERFLQVMVTDGCFLLEMMTMVGYEQDDPVFGRHGALYMAPYVRRDMLIVENQLPLLLEKLLAVERCKESKDMGDIGYEVKKIVLRFISPSSMTQVRTSYRPELHPLDMLRNSLLGGLPDPDKNPRPPRGRRGWKTLSNDADVVVYTKPRGEDDAEANCIIRSATELYDAGIQFRRSEAETAGLHNITFRRGVLTLPQVVVDDSTKYVFLNLMAFEQLHAGAGNHITAYIFFMDNIIDSAADVTLLANKGIIQNAVGSSKAVARLFNDLTKDVVLDPASKLDAVHRTVIRYCRKPRHVRRANLVHTYFRSPWSLLSLTTAVFLLTMTVVQTIYTILQFYQGN